MELRQPRFLGCEQVVRQAVDLVEVALLSS
jgi:hypothetical protein